MFITNLTHFGTNDKVFYYKDKHSGKLQGKFSSNEMDSSSIQMFFGPELQISWVQKQNFISVVEFYNKPLLLIEEALRENKNLSACLKQKSKEDEEVVGVKKGVETVDDTKD